jgi:hypothetical protein
MGVSHTITAGPVLNGSTRQYFVWVQSNNGGTGGAGSVVTAINIETGLKVWQKGDIVGSTVRVSTHEPIPAGAIPGGVVAVDKTGNNYFTHIVYGTLYGEVYVRDAVTGANQNGQTSGVDVPLFKLGADYKPIGAAPVTYKDSSGNYYAAFATGGYVDSQATLWRGANETTVPTQLAFAINLNYSTSTSLTDASTKGTNLPFVLPFKSTSDGAFAQPLVIGSELFFITDTTNVNSYDYGSYANPTGRMYRLDIGGATPSDWKLGTVQDGTNQYFVTIAGGAASLFNSGGKLLTAGGAFGERTFLETNGSTGTAVDLKSTTSAGTRRLWIRTE